MPQLVRRERGRGHRPERPRRCRAALRRFRGGGAGLSRGAANRPRGRLRRGRGHLHGQSGCAGAGPGRLAGGRGPGPRGPALVRKAGPPGIDRLQTATASPRPWCGRARPPRPCPTPGARWRSTPGSARPTSKPPARRCGSASLDRPFGLRNWNPALGLGGYRVGSAMTSPRARSGVRSR